MVYVLSVINDALVKSEQKGTHRAFHKTFTEGQFMETDHISAGKHDLTELKLGDVLISCSFVAYVLYL